MKGMRWFLCFGFLWYEWIVLILLPQVSQDYESLSLLVGSQFAFLGAMLAVLLALVHKGVLKRLPTSVVVAAACVLSASKLVTFFGRSYWTAPAEVIPVVTFFSATSLAVLFYSFACLTNQFDFAETRSVLLASISAGFVIYCFSIVLYGANGIAFGCTEMTYPFAVAFAIAKLRHLQEETGPGTKPSKPAKLVGIRQSIWRITLIMLLFAILVGMQIGRVSSNVALQGRVEVACVTIVVLVAAHRNLRRRSLVSNILNLGRLGIVMGIVGIMIVLLNGSLSILSYAVMMAGYFLFFATMFVFYVTFAQYQTQLRCSEMLSIAMATDSLGISLGIVMGAALQDVFDAMTLRIFFFFALVFVFAVAFFFDKKTLFPVSDAVGEPLQLNPEKVRIACIQIAAENHLSNRQEEIFVLLAFGHRIKEIAEMLGISVATVRTHVNQIYVKLDVHSNAELLARVREAGNRL